MKVIKIDGIKGLITAVFMGVCLFAGFVMFPGLAAMYLWNKYLVTFPVLNLFQGVLLWGMIVVSYGIIFGHGFAVSFKNTPELSEEELESIIKTAKISSKMRMMNNIVSQSDKVEIISKQKDENEQTFASSPISITKSSTTENVEDDKISNIK